MGKRDGFILLRDFTNHSTAGRRSVAVRRDAPENRILTSHYPKRVIACAIESDAFHGDYKKSPFNFKNFSIRDIHLEVGWRMIPAKPQILTLLTVITSKPI